MIQQFRIAGLGGSDTIGFSGVHPTLLPLQAPAVPLDISKLIARSTDWVSTIDGNGGDDTIIGSIGRDRADGGSGSDTLFGFAGDDRLFGGSGAAGSRDVLYAGQGNDDLIGGDGDNELYAWSLSPFSETLDEFSNNGPDSTFGIYTDEAGTVFAPDYDGDGYLDGILDKNNMPVAAARLENTGLNRMLGSVRDDELFGGTAIDFMYGRDGNNTLYRNDGTTFESLGAAVSGTDWIDYARETGQVWYISGTNADDEININYVTAPGLLSAHHLVTILTENGDNFSFDAQVRLDFNATDSDGNHIWNPSDLVTDFAALRNADTDEERGQLIAGGVTIETQLVSGLLPPEGEFLAIILDAKDGNDDITVGPTVQKSVWIAAGAGDDNVQIRGGNAILPDRAEAGRVDGLVSRNDGPGFAYPLNVPGNGARFEHLTLDSRTDTDWFQFRLAATTGTLKVLTESVADELNVQIFSMDRIEDSAAAPLWSRPTPASELLNLIETDLSAISGLLPNTDYLLQIQTNETPTIYGIEFDLPGGTSTAIDLGLRSDSIRRDIILGGEGNDQLQGGPGEDWILGGPGHDVISGGLDRLASDILLGEDGNDTFQIIPDELPAVGNQQNSVFDPVAQKFRPAASDEIDGGPGTDRMLFVGGDVDRQGYDVPDFAALRYNTGLHRYEFTSLVWDIGRQEFREDPDSLDQYLREYLFYQTDNVEQTQIELQNGNDTFHADPGYEFPGSVGPEEWGIKLGNFEQRAREAALRISGGDGDDELFGGALADSISGGGGNDLIFGFQGNDELLGGAGNDTIFGLRDTTALSSITDATNASPITVTTNSTAGLVDGRRVIITGVGGNTATNGLRYVDVLNETQFALYSDAALSTPLTGQADFTSGGTWQTVSLPQRGPAGVTVVDARGNDLDDLGFDERFRYQLAGPFFAQADTGRPGIDLPDLHDRLDQLEEPERSAARQEINVSNQAFGLESSSAAEELSSLRPIGDFNADGLDDFIANTATTSYILLGPVELTDMERVDHFADIVIDHATFGRPAETFGDINGDGYGDTAFFVADGDDQLVTIVFGGSTILVDGTSQAWVRNWNKSFVDTYVNVAGNSSFRTIRLHNSPIRTDGTIDVQILDLTGDGADDLVVAADSTIGGISLIDGMADLGFIFSGANIRDFLRTVETMDLTILDHLAKLQTVGEIDALQSISVGDTNGDGVSELFFGQTGLSVHSDVVTPAVVLAETTPVSASDPDFLSPASLRLGVNGLFADISVELGKNIATTADVYVPLLNAAIRDSALAGRVSASVNGDRIQFSTAEGGSNVALTVEDGLETGTPLFGFTDTLAAYHFIESDDNLELHIPDNTTVSSTLTEANATEAIADISVTVDVLHTFVDDLKITLVHVDDSVSPAEETRVVLFNSAGAAGDNVRHTRFTDSASRHISTGRAPFGGAWQPHEPLAILRGKPVKGQWTLEIEDGDSGDTGTLNSWSLAFRTVRGTPGDREGGITFAPSVLSGLRDGVTTTITLAAASGSEPFEAVSLGDINNDGYDDIAAVHTDRLEIHEGAAEKQYAFDVLYPVADIQAGRDDNGKPTDSDPNQFFIWDDALVFGVDRGIWSHRNGVTEHIQDLNHASPPNDFIEFQDKLYFRAGDGNGSETHELWQFDDNGTATVAPGTGGDPYYPSDPAVYNNHLYFNATSTYPDDTLTDRGLWQYDGATATLIAESSGTSDFNPTSLTVLGDELIFAANHDTDGRELWRYTGTGEPQILDINEFGASDPTDLTVVGDRLYFAASVGATGRELWSYDVINGVQLAADVRQPSTSSPRDLVAFGTSLYFFADGADAVDLIHFDGTDDSIVASGLSSPSELTVLGNDLYFVDVHPASGRELWRYNGTTVELAGDINNGPNSSSPSGLTAFDGALYFSADDGQIGRELWKYSPILTDPQTVIEGFNLSIAATDNDLDGQFNLAVAGSVTVDTPDRSLYTFDSEDLGDTLTLADHVSTAVPLNELPNAHLASGLDLNGDRISDLVVVADASAAHSGRIYTIYGSASRAFDPEVNQPQNPISLDNFSVPGSGSYLVDAGTGQTLDFTMNGDPFMLGASAELWFQFRTLGHGQPGNFLRLIDTQLPPAPQSPVLLADLVDADGRRLQAGRAAFDLRVLPAGDYYLRVFAKDSSVRSFTIQADPPNRQYSGSTTLPDRDHIDGGEGSDQLYGNNDIDRVLGGSGTDTFVTEQIEVRDQAVFEARSDAILDELISQDQVQNNDAPVNFPRLTTTLLSDQFPTTSLDSAIWDTSLTTADDPQNNPKATTAPNILRIDSGQQLVSLPIDTTALSEVEFQFFYGVDGDNDDRQLLVEYEQNDQWVELAILNPVVDQPLELFSASIRAQSTSLRLRLSGSGSSNIRYLVDDVQIIGQSENLGPIVAEHLGHPVTQDGVNAPVLHSPLYPSEISGITVFDGRERFLSDIGALSHLPYLESLDLRNNAALTDVSVVSEMHGLRQLLLDGTAVDIEDPAVVALFDQLSHLEVLTVPVQGLLPGQNLVTLEGVPVSLTTTSTGNWTVTNEAGAAVASGTGTSVLFTPTGDELFMVSHDQTDDFPVYSRNVAPEIQNLPATINLNEGDTRTAQQLLTGVTISHPGDPDLRSDVSVVGPDGIRTALTRGSLRMQNDVILLDHQILDEASDVTVAFWVQPTSTTGFRAFVSAANSSNANELLVAATTPTQLYVSNGESSSQAVSIHLDTPLDDGGWHHIAVVRDDTNDHISVYLDGTLQEDAKSTTLNQLRIDAGGLVFGQEQDSVGGGFNSAQAFDGSVDELVFFRRALNETQISQIYRDGVVGNEADLAAWYPLNGAADDVARDGSIHRRDALVTTVDSSSAVTWLQHDRQSIGSLNLSDDVVQLDHAILDGASDVTVTLWLQSDTPGSFRRIISGANSSDANEFLIVSQSATILRIYDGEPDAGFVVVNLDTPLDDGSWHHLAVIRDSTNDQIVVYQNGVLQGAPISTPLSPLQIDAGGLLVGQEQDSVGGGFSSLQAFDGRIDELAVFHRVLADTEVTDIYDIGVVPNDPDLAAYYPFNESGGNRAEDHSIHNRDGLIQSVDTAIVWSDAPDAVQPDPISGPLVSLDMTNDMIDLDHQILNGATDVTVTFWMQPDVTDFSAVVSGANASNSNALQIAIVDSDAISVTTGFNETTRRNFILDTPLNDGEWHHIAVIRDDANNQISVYLDGNIQGAPQNAFLNVLEIDAGGLVIGQEQDSVGGGLNADESYDGRIAELAFFRRVLTPAQITEIHTNGIVGNEQDLAAWYPLNEASGTTATDHGPFVQHASISSVDGSSSPVAWSVVPPPLVPQAPTRALDFSDDVVLIDHEILNEASDTTITFWIHKESSSFGTVVSAANASTDDEFRISVSRDTIRVTAQDLTLSFDLDSRLQSGRMQHVSIVHDATKDEISVYVDGLLQGTSQSAPLSTLQVDPGGLVVGQDQTRFGGPFQSDLDGALADLAFFQIALTDAEIEEIYENGIMSNAEDLIAYFPFDEADGDVAHDGSPNQRHGLVRPVSSTISPVARWEDHNSAPLEFTAINEGSYRLVVTAVDSEGAMDIAESTITVSNARPTAIIRHSPAGSIFVGTPITLDALLSTDPGLLDNLAYDWEITSNNTVDVNPSAGQTLTFVPQFPGRYTVQLTVTDDSASPQTNSHRTEVELHVVPNTPSFILSSFAPGDEYLEGDVLTFDASTASPAAPNSTRTWSWEVREAIDPPIALFLGDTESFSFVPPNEGIYSVLLTITDTIGGEEFTHTTQSNIPVLNVAPTIDLPSVLFASEGTTLTLTPHISDPGADDEFSYVWSGDLNGTDRSITHSLADDGQLSVTLTVTDMADPTSVAVTDLTIIISDVAPDVTLTAPSALEEGSKVILSGSISNAIGTNDAPFDWSLDFGDGTVVSGESDAAGDLPNDDLSHTYPDSGTYVAILTVTDKDDSTNQATTTVTVQNLAPRNLTLALDNPRTAVTGRTLEFSGSLDDLDGRQPDGENLERIRAIIDFGDGVRLPALLTPQNDDAGPNRVRYTFESRHIFSTAGSYDVILEAFDDDGGHSVSVIPFTIDVAEAPDLLATALALTNSQAGLGETTATFSVSNVGAGAATEFQTHFVWSGNDVLGDTDDVVVPGSSHTIAGIAAGDVVSHTQLVSLDRALLYSNALRAAPAGQGSGTVIDDATFLFLVVDAFDDVVEVHESNNFGVTSNHRQKISYFPWDTDNNGTVTPREALLAIRSIGTTDELYDFDGNGRVTPLEALATLQRIGYTSADSLVITSLVEPQSVALSSVVAHSLGDGTVISERNGTAAPRTSSNAAAPPQVSVTTDKEDDDLFPTTEEPVSLVAPSTTELDFEALDYEFESNTDWLSVI